LPITVTDICGRTDRKPYKHSTSRPYRGGGGEVIRPI